MKIQTINNTAFKAGICTNYSIGDHRDNYWPTLVEASRRTGKDRELDELLRQINEDGISGILALEKVYPSTQNGDQTYITLGLYNSEKDVIKDRKKTAESKPKYSINENGIILKINKSGRAEGYVSSKVCQNFNSTLEAIFFILKQYLQKDSWIHEKITSNRFLESKNYLKLFA